MFHKTVDMLRAGDIRTKKSRAVHATRYHTRHHTPSPIPTPCPPIQAQLRTKAKSCRAQIFPAPSHKVTHSRILRAPVSLSVGAVFLVHAGHESGADARGRLLVVLAHTPQQVARPSSPCFVVPAIHISGDVILGVELAPKRGTRWRPRNSREAFL